MEYFENFIHEIYCLNIERRLGHLDLSYDPAYEQRLNNLIQLVIKENDELDNLERIEKRVDIITNITETFTDIKRRYENNTDIDIDKYFYPKRQLTGDLHYKFYEHFIDLMNIRSLAIKNLQQELRKLLLKKRVIKNIKKISDIQLDKTKSGKPISHRMHIIANQIKAQAGIEPLKTGRDWRKKGQYWYEQWLSLQPKAKKPPTMEEYEVVIEMLEEWPPGQKIAINNKTALEEL